MGEELHVKFVIQCAELRCRVLGGGVTKEELETALRLKMKAGVEAGSAVGEGEGEGEEAKASTPNITAIAATLTKHLALHTLTLMSLSPEEFEKDVAELGHVAFVATSANMRCKVPYARIYCCAAVYYSVL